MVAVRLSLFLEFPLSLVSLDALPLTPGEIAIAGRNIRFLAVRDQDALLSGTAEAEYLPFGLTLWEASIPLAKAVATKDIAERTVLELGAGVGLPGIVAALAGAHVTQIDIDPLALELGARNATANGAVITGRQVDWHDWTLDQCFDLIIGADIVYDTSDHAAVVAVLGRALAPGGTALIADPNRLATVAFVTLLEDAGWQINITVHPTADLSRPGKSVEVRLMELRAPTLRLI